MFNPVQNIYIPNPYRYAEQSSTTKSTGADEMQVDTGVDTTILYPEPFTFIEEKDFDWEEDLYNELLQSFFDNKAQSPTDFMRQFSTPQSLIKLLKAFNSFVVNLDYSSGNLPSYIKCWLLILSACEKSLLEQLDALLEQWQKDMHNDFPLKNFKTYLLKFNDIFNSCMIAFHQRINKRNESLDNIAEQIFSPLVSLRFPLMVQDQNDLPLELSPVTILLGMSKEELLSKPSTLMLKDWLQSIGQQLIQRIVTLEGKKNKTVYHLINLLNGGFYPLRDIKPIRREFEDRLTMIHGNVVADKFRLEEDSDVQRILDSARALIKFISIPYVLSLASFYQKEIRFAFFSYIHPKNFSRLYESNLDLAFEIYRLTGCKAEEIEDMLVNKGLCELRVIYRDQGERLIAHNHQSNYLNIYLNEKKLCNEVINWLPIVCHQGLRPFYRMQLPCDFIFGISPSYKRKYSTDSQAPGKRMNFTSNSPEKTEWKLTKDERSDIESSPGTRSSSSEENNYRMIPASILELLKTKRLRLTGVPKKQWHVHEVSQIMNNLHNNTILDLPLECVYSESAEIPILTFTERENIKLTLTIENIPHEQNQQNKMLAYLNKIKKLTVEVKLHSRTDVQKVLDFALELDCEVNLETDSTYHVPAQFDLAAFLSRLKKGSNLLQNRFLECILILGHFQGNFSLEQIQLLLKIPTFQKNFRSLLCKKVSQPIIDLFVSDPQGASFCKLWALLEAKGLARKLIDYLIIVVQHNPNYTNILISLLNYSALERASESSHSSSVIHFDGDSQRYLLESLLNVPLIAEIYPDAAVSIFIDRLPRDSKNPYAAQILSYLLKNEKTRTVLEALAEQKLDVTWMIPVLSQDSIKRELPLYPKFLLRVIECIRSEDLFDYDDFDFEAEKESISELIETFFIIFLLNKNLLSEEHLSQLDESVFLIFFERVLQKWSDDTAIEKICQFLVPIADNLCIDVFPKYTDTEIKKRSKKMIDFFLKYHWIPSDQTLEKIGYLFISA